jgi:FG-GAP repeat
MKNIFTRSSVMASIFGWFYFATAIASATPTSALPPNPNASILWSLDATLVGRDTKSFDLAGQSVAIDNDTILVGAPAANTDSANSAGVVYVFVRSGDSWVEQAKLQSSSSMFQDTFGASVAIVGDVAVIGAPQNDEAGFDTGAAYVFVRSGTTWVQQAKLFPLMAPGSGYSFGKSVAFDGNRIVIGASGYDSTKPGYVFLFERNPTMWVQTAVLRPQTWTNGDEFGYSVAIAGPHMIIGSPSAIGMGPNKGAAFFYQQVGSTWIEVKRVDSPTTTPGRIFGRTVAISDTTALISEQPASMGLAPGLVHVLNFDGFNWSVQTTLEASEPNPNDDFGWKLALLGNRAVVGARRASVDGQPEAGAAYVFARDAVGWTALETLAEPMPEPNAYFGANVALSSQWLVVGRPGYGQNFTPGAAYVFKEQLLAQGTTCTKSVQCANGFYCADGVCCDVACGDSTADCMACSRNAGAMTDGVCGPAVAGTVCRESVSICDAKEICPGNMGECPFDNPVPGCVDSDSDGLTDTDEDLFGTNPMNGDSDDDGVLDGAEPDWNLDTDKDGIINGLDTDSDNDGLDDGIEVNRLMTDPLDADTDDDCLLDGEEDANHSGTIETFETDPRVSDFDGTCCTHDLDCGTETSGWVCLEERLCIPGCRGSSGNGCPQGSTCSSTDDNTGECILDDSSSANGGQAGNGGDGGAGGNGGIGTTVPIGDNACACRLSKPDELPRGAFLYAACVAILILRQNERTRRFASAKSSATTGRPCGEHP